MYYFFNINIHFHIHFSNRPPPSLGSQLPIPSCLRESNKDDQDAKGQKRKFTDYSEGGNYNFN